jgi:hypothetical protein
MTFKTCRSCGADLSPAQVQRKLFTQFVVKVARCPLCRLRTTMITRRKIVSSKPRVLIRRDLSYLAGSPDLRSS